MNGQNHIRAVVRAIESKAAVVLRPEFLRDELLMLLAAMDRIDEAQRGLRRRVAA